MKEARLKLGDQVIQKLQTVEDPELFVDIVNLGLIYGVELQGEKCLISMTLTTMGCPLNDHLEEHIKQAVLELPEIKKVEVKLVWYPVWSVERMTEAAKKQLGVKTEEPSKIATTAESDRILDVHTPIKQLTERYPELVQDMYEIGFTRITIPGMLQTVGRVMTLELGAKAMKLDLAKVKNDLRKRGYEFDD